MTTSKFVLSREELEACGTTQEAVCSNVDSLKEVLGEFIVATLDDEGRLSVQTIKSIFERTALVRSLRRIDGFYRVVKQIRTSRVPPPSLYQPHGPWFQLRLGYILRVLGEDLIFEHPTSGNPKDIFLPRRNIVIECKSFAHGNKLQNAVARALNDGVYPKVQGVPEGFKKRLTFLGFGFPGAPCQPFEIETFGRFSTSVLGNARSQLLEGVSNVIAFDVDWLTSSPDSLLIDVAKLLSNGELGSVAGIIAIKEKPSSDHQFKGAQLDIRVVVNSNEKVNSLPIDFIERLEQVHTLAA